MYSSGYSQVSKYSPQKKMAYRSKGKSCGYYMRIIFFFSSLIQSLIIVSLVLFLIYGKKQDSASTSRIQDLEESFTRLSIENVALRQQRRNLTTLLNSTTTEKARNEWDLAQLRHVCNISLVVIQDMDRKLQSCNLELLFCKSSQRVPGQCPSTTQDRCNCGVFTEHLQAKLQLENSNFTQTTQRMRMEMDQITKDRDNLHLEVIRLRREQFTHEKEVEFLRHRCKDEFSVSLSGVSNVTKAFLGKIESLFPSHIAFQISCPKQREHLEQIRTNCTTLSKEVEDKFQSYLNNVGQQVSSIISENSGLKAENLRLSEDYRKCTHNRTGLIEQHKRDMRMMQDKHGKDVEKLLVDKMKLIGENEVLTKSAEYRTKESEHLADQLKQLNMSCMPRSFPELPRTSSHQTTPSRWGLFNGGGGSSSSASSSSSLGQPSKIGSSSSLGLFGSAFNKQVSAGSSSSSSSGTSSSTGSLFNKLGSTGTGSSSSSLSSSGTSSSTGSLFNKLGSAGTGSSSSSLSSFGSSSSTGSLFNKLGSTGTGSSSTSLSSSGSSSSTGSLFNKPGLSLGSVGSNPSLSSSGTGLNKPTLSGRGSPTTGLSSGSSGSSPSLSSSGIGLNKPTSSVKSSSGFGSSSGSTGSTNKSGSSSPGFSWLGFGNSNSGQSKTGSGTGKGTSSSNYGGTGSTFGGGRTSGLGGGSGVSVTQHLQDLQRLINPASPEERQDLSRVLG